MKFLFLLFLLELVFSVDVEAPIETLSIAILHNTNTDDSDNQVLPQANTHATIIQEAIPIANIISHEPQIRSQPYTSTDRWAIATFSICVFGIILSLWKLYG